MFDIDTEWEIDGEDVPVRIEVYSIRHIPPDPYTWASDIDYYGDTEVDYRVFRKDTWDHVEGNFFEQVEKEIIQYYKE